MLCLQAGSHTPLQHIHAEYAEIRGRNEMQQARVEDILSQRLAVEQRTKQVSQQGRGLLMQRVATGPFVTCVWLTLSRSWAEQREVCTCATSKQQPVAAILQQRHCVHVQVDSQIATIQSTLDRRLSSLPPSAKQAYSELLAEQAALLAEAGQFEERLAELHGALAAAEGELGRNAFKQRALELQVCTTGLMTVQASQAAGNRSLL